MSAIDCWRLVTKKEKDYLQKKADAHEKSGLTRKEAEIKAVQDYHLSVLDTLEKIYKQTQDHALSIGKPKKVSLDEASGNSKEVEQGVSKSEESTLPQEGKRGVENEAKTPKEIEEANEIAKSKGFDSAAHLLNSVKKRTGKEYETVQDVPNDVLDKVISERDIEKKRKEKIESGRKKINEGMESLATKLGATKHINPLDDSSIWEDVKKIIEGIIEVGEVKGGELIDTLKKELGRLGIKSEHIDEKIKDIEDLLPKETNTKEGTQRKKSVLNRAFEGQGKEEEALGKELESHGLTYTQEDQLIASQKAKEFIEKVGFDAALDAARNAKNLGENRSHVYAQLIDIVNEEMATAEGEELAQLQKMEAQLISDMSNNATQAGQVGAAMAFIYENSDFAWKATTMIEKIKQRNQGKIAPELEAKINEMATEISNLRKERADALERAKKAEDEALIKSIKEAQERDKKALSKARRKIQEARSERNRLKNEFLSLYNPSKSGGRVMSSAIPGAVLVEYGAKIAATYVKEGIAITEEILNKTKEYFAKELKYDLDEKELDAIRTKIDAHLDELDEKEGRVRVSHKMIRNFIEGGVNNIEELVSKIKENIIGRHPNITDREIRDAITGYGKTINPSKDEVETKIRKMIRVGRLVSALEDVAARKRPLRSGKQRDKLEADERALNKELKAAMRDLPIDEETESKQLKTSLDAVKSRLKNQIEELNLAIETGKQSAKARGIEYDVEAKQLENERDQIKEIYDAIFYKRDDDATKIENVLRATEKAIENVIKRIETNNIEEKKQNKINSPDIKAAKERLARLKDRLVQLQEEAGIPERKRLERAKEYAKRQLENLRERLETGNFSKRQKPTPIVKDSELLEIEAKLARVKEEYAKEVYKIELENRTLSQKMIDSAIEIWGLTRVLKATSEFSFMLIQGWVYTTASVRNPKMFFDAFGRALSHFASQKRADDFMAHVKAQEYYQRVKATKLAIAESDAKLSAREETFISKWGKHLWDFTGWVLGLPLKLYKPAFEGFKKGWENANPIKAFERAGNGFLNTIRLTKYLQGEEMLRKEGKNYQNNSQDYKNVADVVNTFTGRASLGALDRISKPLAIIFFSPKNWASIIKTTTPLAFYHFGRMGSKSQGETTFGLLKQGKVKPSAAQKLALMDYFTAVGVTTAMMMLIDSWGDDDKEEEKISIEKDPRSSDFMKIKIGDTRIDPWGGRIQMIILQSRLITGAMVNSQGQKKRLGEGYTSNEMELLGNMVKNKLAPTTVIVFDLMNKKVEPFLGDEIWTNQYGGPLLLTDPEATYAPIFWGTIEELYKEHPESIASFLTFLAFIGEGVNTYDSEKQKAESAKYILDKKLNRLKELSSPEEMRKYMDELKQYFDEYQKNGGKMEDLKKLGPENEMNKLIKSINNLPKK